ncbi:MAG: hypothetical protein JO307_04925 [Bryobacterales bacterium]|nr:hypothetical protein [Bryobacterales bacterium]
MKLKIATLTGLLFALAIPASAYSYFYSGSGGAISNPNWTLQSCEQDTGGMLACWNYNGYYGSGEFGFTMPAPYWDPYRGGNSVLVGVGGNWKISYDTGSCPTVWIS